MADARHGDSRAARVGLADAGHRRARWPARHPPRPRGNAADSGRGSGREQDRADAHRLAPEPAGRIRRQRQGRCLSRDKGQTWKKVGLPKKIRVAPGPSAVDFVSAKTGFFIDSNTRVWKTVNAGKKWTQVFSAGTSFAEGISMADGTNGLIPVRGIGGRIDDPNATAYVLRTSDGGRTWRLQAIARGLMSDALATGPLRGYALVGGNHSFFTDSGGDAGNPTSLSLKTTKKSFTKKTLKRAKSRVTVSGTRPACWWRADRRRTARAERVALVAADRHRRGRRWQLHHQLEDQGLVGVVAQWAGDSGRRGAGSVPLVISVKRGAELHPVLAAVHRPARRWRGSRRRRAGCRPSGRRPSRSRRSAHRAPARGCPRRAA